jgi:hypothetical protein
MNMAKPRKKLAPRLYTYEKLESLLRLHGAGKRSHRLYNCIAVNRHDPYIQIVYCAKSLRVVLATVGRGSNGDTVYTVPGMGSRGKTPESAAAIRKWRQYVPVFTPCDGKPFAAGTFRHWRVRDGVATWCERKPGTWMHVPRSVDVTPDKWADVNAKMYPNFPRRCKFFATRLRKALAAGPPAVMSLLSLRSSRDTNPLWNIVCAHGDGPRLSVCTPPTATQDGRRLLVTVLLHDKDSRQHHHIDGDYGIKHNQFIALEDGKALRGNCLRWKCSKDAIAGIAEWIIGDNYIPGPDSY